MGKRKSDNCTVFEDYFPAMIEKLGGEGFMNELCKGFGALMDYEKRVITMESLKMNCAVLGLWDDVIDEEMLRSMLSEGDLDGDGCLDLFEFCVLMFRLSPGLMDHATIMFLQFK